MLLQKEAKQTRGNPETPRTGTPARNGYAVPKRGLNGAYKGLWAHCPLTLPLPRSGGEECLSHFLLILLFRLGSKGLQHKGLPTQKYLQTACTIPLL